MVYLQVPDIVLQVLLHLLRGLSLVLEQVREGRLHAALEVQGEPPHATDSQLVVRTAWAGEGIYRNNDGDMCRGDGGGERVVLVAV